MTATRGAARLGGLRKVYSRRGTLLGTVSYPDWWDHEIQQRGGMRFQVVDPDTVESFTRDTDHGPLVFRTMTIVIDPIHQDGVRIEGVSMEEFEQQPDCAFHPGAGYLRSMLE